MFVFPSFLGKDGAKVTTVVATPGQGTDRVQEVSYSDTKVIGNGSFGVVFQAKLCDTGELVAIKKVLQDRRFKVCVHFFFYLLTFFFFSNYYVSIDIKNQTVSGFQTNYVLFI